MSELYNKITFLLKEAGMLPIYCMTSEEEIETIMNALVKTPIRCIEIILRHPFAVKAIEIIKEKYPEFIVGAGTVVSPQILKKAIKSGADFFVSPGLDEKVIKIAKKKKLVFIAGCSTPSEILKAQVLGFNVVKFFPAECSGGVKALKLYRSAFPEVSFVATGNITYDNIRDYNKCANILACGGTFMFSKEKVKNGDSEGIYTDLMKGLEHIKGEVK